MLHIEAVSNDGLLGTNQLNDNAGILGANITRPLQSYWFVKSETLGKVGVGLQSQASDNTAILVDGSGSLIAANWVAFDTGGFFLRRTNGALVGAYAAIGCGNMGGAWGDCNGGTRNVVRYDSPLFAGFSVSASWGEDDMWDVAARYAGEFSGFKLAAAAAYNEVSDEGFNGTGLNGDTGKYFQAGAYLQHVPTGLFVLGNYGKLESDIVADETETWYVKAGVRTRLLRHSAILYSTVNTLIRRVTAATWCSLARPTNLTFGALASCRKLTLLRCRSGSNIATWNMLTTRGFLYEDFQYVGMGAIINF